MAVSPPSSAASSESGKNSGNIAVALAIVTIIGVALGGGAGIILSSREKITHEAIPAANPEPEKDTKHVRFPAEAVELPMAPIIATIGTKANNRVRLECSLIMATAKDVAAVGPLKTEITEDIITFLRGVSIDDVSGAHGFQNLREDLDELARIRGRGTVLGLLISGFVLE